MGMGLFPWQYEPPFAGDGLSHDLYLFNPPLPHVAEHILHAPHALHPPFTMVNKNICVVHIDIQQYHNNVEGLLVITFTSWIRKLLFF